MKPSVASAWTSSLIVVATVSGEPMNDCRPVTSMISSRADRFSASALARHSPASGDRVRRMPDAGPALGDQLVADHRVEGGQRAVGVVVGQVAVPQLLEELDRGLRRHLGQAHLVGELGRLGVGVAEHERGRGQDQQLVAGPAELRQPALHVGVEGLPGLQRAVPGEDRVRRRGGEVAALVGVAGLEDHRPALRAARHVELPGDVEERVVVPEGPRGIGGEELPVPLSATISSPCQESNSSFAVARKVLARS